MWAVSLFFFFFSFLFCFASFSHLSHSHTTELERRDPPLVTHGGDEIHGGGGFAVGGEIQVRSGRRNPHRGDEIDGAEGCCSGRRNPHGCDVYRLAVAEPTIGSPSLGHSTRTHFPVLQVFSFFFFFYCILSSNLFSLV